MVRPEDLEVFKGKRVLVTGSTGFKGAWLCLWLHDLGAEVFGYALPPRHDDDLFHLLGLEGLISQTYADIRDLSALQRTFNDFRPEFVFHLAAQALVRRSFAEPKLTFDTNTGGSVNLLEAVRSSASVRSVVYITSDKCYRNKEWVWGYREDDELGGTDPYSASKAAAEIVFSCYLDFFFRQRTDLGVASVRAGNVIGGGDASEDRIVPDCVRALRSGRPIVLRSPAATRPWQYVLEPLSGYLTVAARLTEDPQKYAGSWNFGPSAESIHTVKELAERLVSYWGSGEVVVPTGPGAPHEAWLLHLNCEKAMHLLGWRPRWNFDRAIEEVVRWHKQVAGGRPAADVTRDQIADYLGMPALATPVTT
jgi:CDP-glucose 4,6-dehydratase